MEGKTFVKSLGIFTLAIAPLFAGSQFLKGNITLKDSDLEKKVEQRVVQSNSQIVKYNKHDSQDSKDMQNILYAEAANQSSRSRKAIAKTIFNRVNNKGYPSSIHSVIFERNAFSCINDSKNKNWEQATGKIKRNSYENRVYERCSEDGRAILNGEKLGISRENEIIAYHDISIKKPDTKYWNSLEPVIQIDRLIFYAPKE